jgi:hypothetical protein
MVSDVGPQLDKTMQIITVQLKELRNYTKASQDKREGGCHKLSVTGMDNMYAGSVGTLVTSEETISRDPTRRSTIIKSGEMTITEVRITMKRNCQYYHPHSLISHSTY